MMILIQENINHIDQEYVNGTKRLDVDLKTICNECEAKKVMEDMQIKEVEELDVDLKTICNEYEAKKVMEDMQTTVKEVEESEYYITMVKQLRNIQQLQDNILHVLGRSGSDNKEEEQDYLQMVICGLGSIQFNYNSQYQLALAILLRRDFSHWIGGNIISFDPKGTTLVDAEVMKDLGCNDINEQDLKRWLLSDRPTLLFMPHILCSVIENFLKENWRPSRLNKIVLLTDSFRKLYNANHVIPRPYLKAILEHTIEYDNTIKTGPWKPFSYMKWHFFNLLTTDDDQLEAMLPNLPQRVEVKEEEKEDNICRCDYQNESNMKKRRKSSCINFLRCDYQNEFDMENYPRKLKDRSWNLMGDRYPSRPAKREWCPPSTGWIKLNFSAAAAWSYKDGGKKLAVGYGCIFHNENNECFLTYHRVSELLEVREGAQVDLDFLNAVALMKGLRFYIDKFYSTNTTTTATTTTATATTCTCKKLVVEGNSVRIARWVSRIVPPPKKLAKVFKDIRALLSRINEHLVFHIHKEANSMAIDLANKIVTNYLEQT